MFTIGAFSRLCGVSAKALRAYDASGLFRPAWVDPFSGYRRYSPAQLPEIRRIAALRATGMGLAEIRDALRTGDLRDALARRRAALEEERAGIDRRLAELDIRVGGTGSGGASADDGLDVVVRNLVREPVATLSLDIVPSGDPESAFDELEAFVRDLAIRAHRPPGMLIDSAAGEVVYVPVRRAFRPSTRIGSDVLPPVRAATILHRGGYDGLRERRRELTRWIERAGLRPAGPLRILYLQFGAEAGLRLPPGWVVDRPAEYLTELQVPVEP